MWLRVTIPISSYAIPQAREFVESYPFAPPATVYGMLLSMIGEQDRTQYRGIRLGLFIKKLPESSVILRKIRRVKNKDLNHPNNSKPDYQTVLTGLDFLVRVSDGISNGNSLTEKLQEALLYPERIKRFGGLSCGESHNLVDQIRLLDEHEVQNNLSESTWVLMPSEEGDWTCPVWVDHVGSSGTVWAKAVLVPIQQGFSLQELNDFLIDSQ